MMDYDSQLKLQAYFDGELPENEAREVANRLARDSESVALLTELRNTRKAFKGFESDIKLPETREFFWSKIEREIGRLEPAEPNANRPAPVFAWWRKYLVPAAAFAALLVMVALTAKQLNMPIGPALFSRGRSAQFTGIETAMMDNGAFTYRDQAAGITVVWLSYPGENEFAGSGRADTIQ